MGRRHLSGTKWPQWFGWIASWRCNLHVVILAARADLLHWSNQMSEYSSDLKPLFSVTSPIMGMKTETQLPDHASLPPLLEIFDEFFVEKVETIRETPDQDSTPVDCY